MLKVIIDETENVRINQGTSKSGAPFKMISQKAWVYQKGAPYPIELEFPLEDNQTPYAPGEYMWDMESLLSKGNFGSPAIQFPRGKGVTLQPLKSAAEQTEQKTDKPKSLFGAQSEKAVA